MYITLGMFSFLPVEQMVFKKMISVEGLKNNYSDEWKFEKLENDLLETGEGRKGEREVGGNGYREHIVCYRSLGVAGSCSQCAAYSATLFSVWRYPKVFY